MKKCNFLAVLVTALFMFTGSGLFSQDARLIKRASESVTKTVKSLKKEPAAKIVNQSTVSNSNASALLNRLKIKVGELILLELKKGSTVNVALANAISSIPTGNSTEKTKMKSEVEVFYKNLLKI